MRCAAGDCYVQAPDLRAGFGDFIGGIVMNAEVGVGSRGLCGFVSGDVTSNIVELPTNYQKLPNW